MSTSCYVQIVTLSPWESSRTYAAMLMEGLCQADGVQQTRCGVTFEDDDCIKIITCQLSLQYAWRYALRLEDFRLPDALASQASTHL